MNTYPILVVLFPALLLVADAAAESKFEGSFIRNYGLEILKNRSKRQLIGTNVVNPCFFGNLGTTGVFNTGVNNICASCGINLVASVGGACLTDANCVIQTARLVNNVAQTVALTCTTCGGTVATTVGGRPGCCNCAAASVCLCPTGQAWSLSQANCIAANTATAVTPIVG